MAKTATFPAYPELATLLADPDLSHPDPTTAQVMSTAAGYAYGDIGTVAMMMTRMGLENSQCRQISRSVDAMLINSTAHLVQSYDRELVVLAFRGTPPLDIISWLLDADVYPERIAAATPEGEATDHEVHAGFYRNVRVTRHEILEALLRALKGESILGEPTDGGLEHIASSGAREEASTGKREPLKALYVTGHSLGGAMAVLFSSMLVMSENEKYQELAARLRAVYTFGQPMVGGESYTKAAAEAFAERRIPVLRYVYKRDPIPHLPPDILGDYVHFGQEYRLGDEDGSWLPSAAAKPAAWATGLVSSVASYGLTRFAPLRHLPFPYKIEDHIPHHYVSSLVPPGRLDEFGDYPRPARS